MASSREPDELSPAAPLARRRPRVLLVEDDPSVLDVFQRGLGSKGFEVATARDAEEACAVFQREGGRFDLLITDVVLPRRDGPDLARSLEQKNPRLKTLYVSGYPRSMLDDQALPEGSEVLEKPAGIGQLMASIRAVLGEEPPRPAPLE